jgi:Zn-dependent M28 family amino/carboxypeptidase
MRYSKALENFIGRRSCAAKLRAQALCLVAASFVGGCTPPVDRNLDAGKAMMQAVSAARVRADMEVLAADDMGGREAGTADYARAAAYVAAQFGGIGLRPLGDAGSFLQSVEFVEARLVPGTGALTLRGRGRDLRFAFGGDFMISGGYGDAEETVTAPLVFAGYGIRAPERNYDDFSGIDVRGTILVVFTGAPSAFGTSERAFYSSLTEKHQLARALGAVGVVTVQTPVDRKRTPWQRILDTADHPSLRWRKADGTAHEGFAELKGNAALSPAGAAKLFRFIGHDLDRLFEEYFAGKTKGFEIDASATLARRSLQRRVSSPNVIGLLPGSDPRLSGEFVLVTAHLDHLGVKSGATGDAIYNGAYDNAAGVGVMLEIARVFAAAPTRPRRSIIFAAVTAEEQGLRGSDYLAQHPPVPIEAIVANLNFDMPYLGFPIADVEGYGIAHSTLEDALNLAAATAGVRVTADNKPELVRLIRSDQFSFVKRGVPGVNLKPGSMSADPSFDGAALTDAFLSERYHQPGDDLAQPFSERGAETFVRTGLMFALIVANDARRVAWKPDDFFGERFGRRRPGYAVSNGGAE